MRSELMNAVQSSDTKVVKQLIAAGADVDEVWEFTENVDRGISIDQQRTALMLAADQGNLDIVKMLVQAGANLEITDGTGSTTLLLSLRYRHPEVARYLIDAGARVDHVDGYSGDSALSLAAQEGWTDLVTSILERTGDLSKTGKRALEAAVCRGHEPVVKMLLERGVQSPEAFTAAAQQGNIRMMELTSAGRSLSRTDLGAALNSAAYTGKLDAVEQLLSKGADINWQDQTQWTALTYAAYAGHRKIVELLLSKGAKTNVVDVRGKTAVEWAEEAGHDAIVQLLQQTAAR